MDEKLQIKKRFASRIAVLQKFGFAGKAWQQAIWPIQGQTNRYVWFANRGDYDGGKNTLSDNGETFTDSRDSNAVGADNYGTHASADVERILFLITKQSGRNVIEFAGVFKPDTERFKPAFQRTAGNVSAWKRVSVECSPPDGSWQATNV